MRLGYSWTQEAMVYGGGMPARRIGLHFRPYVNLKVLESNRLPDFNYRAIVVLVHVLLEQLRILEGDAELSQQGASNLIRPDSYRTKKDFYPVLKLMHVNLGLIF